MIKINLTQRIAIHLGAEIATNGSSEDITAFTAMCAMADLGVIYCNEFLTITRHVLYRTNLADVTSEAERLQIKSQGKAAKPKWERAVKKESKKMIENF